MKHKEISFQEFEKAFKTLKRNKAIGYDFIKVIFSKTFKVSFEEAVFPEKLKITKITPAFKTGDK